MYNICQQIIVVFMLSLLPYASSDCLEFWKTWRTCPSDFLSEFSQLLCFHQVNNTDQALISKTSPKEAGIVCHSDNFPVFLFSCLPIANTTLFLLTNCPFPHIPFFQLFQDQALQQLGIKFNRVKKQTLPLIIDGYLSLQTISLEGIHTDNYFDFQLKNLPSLHTFNIYVYNFTRMPNKPFRNVPQLQELFISVGPLEIIPDDFFYGASKLSFIDFSLNRLKVFQTPLLKETVNLVRLNLSHNHLVELDQEIFHSTKNLESLFLDHNRLIYLSPELFRPLISLKHLFLSNNNITALHEDIFHHLSSLDFLLLDHNNIQSLPVGIFRNLVSLIRLDLQYNKITAFSENLFKFQNFLHYLDLSGNEISTFNSSTPFGSSKFLFTVNISKNQLTEIPDVKWEVYNISSLDLSHNKIQRLVFPEGLLNDCMLDLQYNQIESVSTKIYLPPGPVLNYYLLLQRNPFNCNCSLSNFVKSLQILPIKDKEMLQCHTPWFHKYKKVTSMNENDLCLNDVFCPIRCKCIKLESGEIYVDCSNVERTNSPIDLPSETTSLNLSNSFISEITSSQTWSKLNYLYVSNNSLLTLTDFVVPSGLKTLAVDGNYLSDIPQTLRDHVEATENFKIYVADNAWICNCHSVSFKKWFMRNLPKIQDSMRTYCIKNIRSGERSLLVETRVDEFVCSSSAKKYSSLFVFVTLFVLFLLFK